MLLKLEKWPRFAPRPSFKPKLLEGDQRPFGIWVGARVQHLDTRVVIAGKRRLGTRTTSLNGVVMIVEPNSNMVDIYRRRLHACFRFGKWSPLKDIGNNRNTR